MSDFANRVKETTSTTGSGSFTTTGAVSNFQTFNGEFGLNRRFFYWAVNGIDEEWENGIGYLSGTTTLVRNKILSSSNNDAVVTFTTAPILFCDSEEGSHEPAIPSIPAGSLMFSYHMREVGDIENLELDTNEILYIPFLLSIAESFDEFWFNLLTASSGDFVRMGLYDVKDALPHNLIAVHDTSFSIGTTGIKNLSFDGGAFDLVPGWYFIGIVTDGTPGFDATSAFNGTITPLGVNEVTDNGVPYQYITKTFTYAAMPDPANVSSLTYIYTGGPPLVGLVQSD